ncbi:hypothetical protein DEO72_LG6g2413 [Vigna unguiculata]|uniref:Uncharacterized protein n=1 Tax=Vigna unguiculata TaxID=3917 RepID=A0A4D6M8I0_VIGUN|nr:hypothetical protein DEO72_LG6g2413 [Vigna unguiculata]
MLLNFLARSHELFSHAHTLHAIAEPAPPKFTSIPWWQSLSALRRRRHSVGKGGTENKEGHGNGWNRWQRWVLQQQRSVRKEEYRCEKEMGR